MRKNKNDIEGNYEVAWMKNKKKKGKKNYTRIIHRRECEPVYQMLITLVHNATWGVMPPLGGGLWDCISNHRALWGWDKGLFIF